MKRSKKRAWIVIAAIAAVALSALGAYAYWTTTGSGSGSGDVADSNGTLALTAVVAGELYPGGDSNVTFTATNASSTNLYVDTISLDGVTADAGHSGCNTADFSMADVESDTIVPGNATSFALNGNGTLEYANTNVNQDACKGATLTLSLSSD